MLKLSNAKAKQSNAKAKQSNANASVIQGLIAEKGLKAA